MGTAITKGANGMGGTRYQIAAIVLTYVAISVAAIPIWISYSLKHPSHPEAQAQRATAQTSADNSENDGSTSQPQQTAPPSTRPPVDRGKLFVQLIFMGLASPFLQMRDPIHGLIGLVILFVGLRIAFRLTAARPLEVDGPYKVTG